MKHGILNALLFAFLLGPLFSSAQTKYPSGEVTYGVELGFEPTEEQKSDNSTGFQFFKKQMQQAGKSASTFKPILQFNSSKAKFYAEEHLENDANRGLKLARVFVKLNGAYYTDLEKEEILQEREVFGKNYLVEDGRNKIKDWTITAQTDTTGNYTVYKATKTETLKNSKGTFESPIIAWFAPEIPFSYGPIGYGGLPGLILELEVQSSTPVRYFAKTVDFQKEKMNIQIPDKGERITAEELNRMYRKARGNFSGN